MARRIQWPDGHKFAFTVIDDTDGATVESLKPVYDYLYGHNILTTKTCWAYPSRDDYYSGQCFEDREYLDFLIDIKNKGFEMAFHNAGSGGFKREETLAALDEFKEHFGEYPRLHINHGENIENIYWGAERFKWPISKIYGLGGNPSKYYGNDPKSEYFWGDFVKEHIKFVRNRTFTETNTLKADPRLVYKETGREKYSNYWFSASDGMRLKTFLWLLKKEKIDKLVENSGCCIVYTHFAYEFVENGKLNEDFKKTIDYIASKDGWFVPASQIFEYLLKDKEYKPSKLYEAKMDAKWLAERILKRVRKLGDEE